jgi:hypothetical protein
MGTAGDMANAWRQEIKFILRRTDVESVDTILRANARPVRFGTEATSNVNSIYFDDAHLSGCRESIAGLGRRFKLRVRWYDTTLPHRQLFFEVKQRRNSLGRKLRLAIPHDATRGSSSYDELLRQWRRTLDQESLTLLDSRDVPTALISYHRRHFVDADSGLRLTLDHDVTVYDQLERRRPWRRFPVALDDLVVLEVKGRAIDADRVRELIHPLTPRRARCSKYVLGCAALGWTGDLQELR